MTRASKANRAFRSLPAPEMPRSTRLRTPGIHVAKRVSRVQSKHEQTPIAKFFFHPGFMHPSLRLDGTASRIEEKSVNKIASLTIALALGWAGGAMAQEHVLTQQEITAQLAQQGYTDVHDVNFHDGVWTARARSGNDEHVKLRIDPITGLAYPNKQVSRLTELDVRASLSAQGYTHVHDVDFHHGIWTAKAKSSAGIRVSLQIDAETGRIIGSD
jgi:hypothetical protein